MDDNPYDTQLGESSTSATPSKPIKPTNSVPRKTKAVKGAGSSKKASTSKPQETVGPAAAGSSTGKSAKKTEVRQEDKDVQTGTGGPSRKALGKKKETSTAKTSKRSQTKSSKPVATTSNPISSKARGKKRARSSSLSDEAEPNPFSSKNIEPESDSDSDSLTPPPPATPAKKKARVSVVASSSKPEIEKKASGKGKKMSSKAKGKAPVRKSKGKKDGKKGLESDDEMELFAGSGGIDLDEIEPNPMPSRRKSAGGTTPGGSKKNAVPTTPTAAAGSRRSKRRQAEPEVHDSEEEDAEIEDSDDYEDMDEDDDEDETPVKRGGKNKGADKPTDQTPAGALAGILGSLPRVGEASSAELERLQALMNTLAGGSGGIFGRTGMGGPRSEVWTNMLKDLKDPKASNRYSALQEATTTIALAEEDQFHRFPWEEAVKVFLGLMSGKPITDNSSKSAKIEPVVDENEEDFDMMTEEQQMRFAMALSSGGEMPSMDSDLDPDQEQQAQLLACRCLQNLMMSSEGHGMTAGYIVRNDGVKVLCSKLTSIDNIELAEQVIVTLAKLAEYQSRGTGIIQEDGLKIMLDILDFFDIHVQKSIVTAVIYSCRQLTTAEFPKIKEILPNIRGLFGRSDAALVEGAANVVYRLLNSYVYKAEILEDILDRDMVDAISAALTPGSGAPQLSASVFANLLKVLTAGVRSSAKITLTLFEADFPRTIYFILTGLQPPDETDIAKGETAAPAEAVIMQTLSSRPKEVIEEILSLACELLPPPPKDGVFDSRNYSERMLARYTKAKDKMQRQIDKGITPDSTLEEMVQAARASAVASMPSSTAPTPQVGTPPTELGATTSQPQSLGMSGLNQAMEKRGKEAEAATLKRQEVLQENAGVVNTFSKILIPVIVDVYNASAALKVRSRILNALLRSITFCETKELQETLKNVPLASFLSSILTTRDHDGLVGNALQLAELLLTKLTDVYTRSFQREGVFHEIEKLANEGLSVSSLSKQKEAANAAAKKADVELLGGQSGSAADDNTGSGTSGATAIPTSTETAASSLLRTLASESSTASSVFERAMGITPTQTPTGNRKSSVPVNLHDCNIVRARILQVKRWSLTLGERTSAAPSSTVDGVITSLSDSSISDKDLALAFEQIGTLLSDKIEPLSSFEMLQSGLVAKLMDMLQAGEYATAHRAILFDVLSAVPANGESSAFSLLVRRLQDALSRLDIFEVDTGTSGPESETRRTPLPNILRTMAITLVADSQSPQPLPWKGKAIEIALPCIAPVSSINSFLRSTSRFAGGATSGGVRSDLDALLGGGPSKVDTDAASHTATSTRRSARLRGEAADDSTEATSAKQADDEASVPKLEVKSNSDDDDGENEEEHGILIDEDMMLLDDMEEDMDEEDGIFLEEGPEDEDDEGGDQLQEKTVELEISNDGSKPQGITPNGTRVATPVQDTSAADASRVTAIPPKTRSYAAALKAPTTDYHYRFLMDGHDVGHQESLYGALTRVKRLGGNGARVGFFERHVLKVRKCEGPAPLPECEPDAAEHVDPASEEGLPWPLKKDSPQAVVLRMLRIIHSINEDQRDRLGENNARVLDETAFVNAKITAKFIRQLDEILLVACDALPDWATELPQSFRFLFPFDARYLFMQSTSFGLPRMCQKRISASAANGTSSRQPEFAARYLPLPRRQPLRIDRKHMLMSVRRAMELWGHSQYILDFQYIDEHGTGLGPSLEFYSLASKAFATRVTRMWRDEDPAKGEEWVHHPHGLFPRPFGDEGAAGPLEEQGMAPIFQGLGTFVGRALYDSRIIDLHFNKVFLRAVLGDKIELSLDTLRLVDPELARTMGKLEEVLSQKKLIDNDQALSKETKLTRYQGLTLDGASIEDLALDFTTPGYPEVLLKKNGSEINVDLDNLAEYITLVYKTTLETGIAKSVELFREGFSRIFPVRELCIFSPDELGLLFGNPDEDWSRETIESVIKADHGYHSDSKQVRYLIDLMVGYTKPERRTFLRFITGAPKLPLGGFKALHPQFTVVRKREPPPFKPDDYLPSVMTCAQYLKLPEYSTKEIMETQLHRAMHEGAEGFLLS